LHYLLKYSLEVADSMHVRNYLQGFNNFIYFFRGEGGTQFSVVSCQLSVVSRQKLPAHEDFVHALIVRQRMVIICKPPAMGLTALRATGCGNG
jgi:hypothetical protein